MIKKYNIAKASNALTGLRMDVRVLFERVESVRVVMKFPSA